MILSLMVAQGGGTQWLRQGNEAIWDTAGAYYASAAGEQVTPSSAMGLAAYYACIQALAQDSAKLPIKIMRDVTDTKREWQRKHPYAELLNRVPNPNATAITLRQFLVGQCAGWGNGYWEIVRDGGGRVIGFIPLQSARMTPRLDAVDSLWWEYRDNVGTKHYAQDQVVHLCGYTPNGYVGWSVAHYAAQCLGAGLAQQKYAAAFYGNGAVPLVVLEHPTKLSPEARDRLRADWNRMHRGADSAHRTAVLQEGMTARPLAVNPKDAETIETRRFTIEEVCRWFRMPPAKIQHYFQAKGWASAEAENQHYLTDTLMPWLEAIEAELDRKLFPDGEYHCEHDTRRLLRADAKGRSEYYSKMFSIGGLSRNEIRAEEGMDDAGPDGDHYYVPVNVQTVERSLAAPAPPPDEPSGEDKEEDDSQVRDVEADDKDAQGRDADAKGAQLRWIEHALARLQRKEAKALPRLAAKHANNGYAGAVSQFFAAHQNELSDEIAPATGDAATPAVSGLLRAYCARAVADYKDAARAADVAEARAGDVHTWAVALDAVIRG